MSKTYLVKGTFWILAGMLFGQSMAYVNTVAALRFVDVSTYGTVVFLLSLMAIAAILTKQGLHIAVTKFIPEYTSLGRPETARRIFNNARWLIILAALLLTALSPLIYALMPNSVTEKVRFSVFALLFVPYVFATPLLALNQFGLNGLKIPKLSAIVGYVFEPSFRIVSILVILAALPTVTGLVYSQILPLVAAYLVSEAVIHKKGLAIGPPAFAHNPVLYRFALPQIGTDLLTVGLYSGDRILLGYLTDPESVGIYHVANRIAFLVIIPFWAGAQAVAPLFSEYWAQNRVKQLGEIYRYWAYVFLFVVGSILVMLWINVGWILRLFGARFGTPETVSVTMILSVSLFLTILPGNISQLLRMSGRNYLWTLNILVVSAMNLILNFILIPRFGVVGAAVATGIALVSGHLIGFILLRTAYKNAFGPFSRNYFVILAAIGALTSIIYFSDRLILNNVLALSALFGLGYPIFKKELARGWGIILGRGRSG